MESKIMQIFYGNDCLPYKDRERQVHYPIIGQSFSGASLTTDIRFYVRDIGGVDGITWIANAKRADGKIAYKQLSATHDDDVNEYYVSLQLSQWFTEKKGDLFIALNGYAGGVDITVDSESGLYTVSGTPIIQATGSVKITIAYAPIMNNGYGSVPLVSVQEALGVVSSKLDKNSTKYIKLLDSLAEINSSSNSEYLNEGDIIAVRDDGNYRFELFELNGTYPNFEANELAIYIEYGYFNDLIANSATFSETDNVMFADTNESLSWLLYQKADKSDTYTKAQVDTFGKSFELTMDSDYKLYATLKDANGNVLGTTQVVDLPLESVVVGGSYDSVNKALILTLDNGNTITIPVGDLISGLVSEEQLETALEEKQDTLVSGENIKTINGTTLLGNGNYEFDIAFNENSTNALQNKIISRKVREINYQLAVIREELFESVLTEIDYTVDFATLYAIPDTLSDDDGTHRVVYSETQLKRIEGNTIQYNAGELITGTYSGIRVLNANSEVISTISVPTTELKSAGSAHDYIEVVEGNIVDGEQLFNLVKHILVGNYTFTGSETFGGGGNDGIFVFSQLSNVKAVLSSSDVGNVLCDGLQPSSANGCYSGDLKIAITTGSFFYLLNKNYVNDMSGFKSWLTGKTMQYEITNPTEEVIATNLHFDEISSLIEQGGSIEPIYTNVPPNITTTFVVKKAVGE